VVAVSVLEAVLMWACLLAIPAVFPIEGETATEIGDWPNAGLRIFHMTRLRIR